MTRTLRLLLVIACAAARPAAAQGVQVVDLGGGIHQAIGAMGGTMVRMPQSNTFMVVTSGGNVIVDTSLPRRPRRTRRR